MLNVEYIQTSCGCNCYRDWEYEQSYFSSDNIVTQGTYAEPTLPPKTVCDVGGGGDVCAQGQPNCFNGVAAEKLADRLILTTQMDAGWYRYVMKWRFYPRRTDRAGLRFRRGTARLRELPPHAPRLLALRLRHRRRAAVDVVTEGPNPARPPAPGPRPRIVTLPTETTRVINYPGITWSVTNSATHRGYRVVPGLETALPADSFSQGDLWALRYHAAEIDDGHGSEIAPSTSCRG